MSGCQNHSIRQQEKLSGGDIIVKPCTAVVTNTRKLVKFMKWFKFVLPKACLVP